MYIPLAKTKAIQCFRIYGTNDEKDREFARAEILRFENQLLACDAMRRPENNQ